MLKNWGRVFLSAMLVHLYGRTGATGVCSTQGVPEGAFVAAPQVTGLDSCEWFCEDGSVRCSVVAWDEWPSPPAWSGAEPVRGSSAGGCAQLPTAGAILRVTASGVVSESVEAAHLLISLLVASGELAREFPKSRPCWVWLRERPRDNVSRWATLTSPFELVGAIGSVGQPEWAERVSVLSLQATEEDRVDPGFAELEVLVLSNDDAPLSLQAARLRLAVAVGLGENARAVDIPSARWVQAQGAQDTDTQVIVAMVLFAIAVLAVIVCAAWKLFGGPNSYDVDVPLLPPQGPSQDTPPGPAPQVPAPQVPAPQVPAPQVPPPSDDAT
jgi:hypothetical protein